VNRHAGLVIVFPVRPEQGIDAPVARKERHVHIERTQPGMGQRPSGDPLGKRRHDDHVGPESFDVGSADKWRIKARDRVSRPRKRAACSLQHAAAWCWNDNGGETMITRDASQYGLG